MMCFESLKWPRDFIEYSEGLLKSNLLKRDKKIEKITFLNIVYFSYTAYALHRILHCLSLQIFHVEALSSFF